MSEEQDLIELYGLYKQSGNKQGQLKVLERIDAIRSSAPQQTQQTIQPAKPSFDFSSKSTEELTQLVDSGRLQGESRAAAIDEVSRRELQPEEVTPQRVQAWGQRKGQEFYGAAKGGLELGLKTFGAGVGQAVRQGARGVELALGADVFGANPQEYTQQKQAQLGAEEEALRAKYPRHSESGLIGTSKFVGEALPMVGLPMGSVKTAGQALYQGGKAGLMTGLTKFGETGELKERAELVLEGLGTGAVTGYGLGKLSEAIENRAVRKIMDEAVPSIPEMRQRADALYGSLETAGIKIPARELQNTFNRIESVLETQTAYRPDRYPTVKKALDDIFKNSGQDMSFWDFDGMRRFVRGHSRVSSGGGIPHPEETRMIRLAIDELDEMFARLPNTVKGKGAGEMVADARRVWGRMRTAEAVDEALYRASLSPSEFGKAIQSEFRTILRSENKRRAFNKAELAQMEQIVKGSGAVETITTRIGDILGTDAKSVVSMIKTGMLTTAATNAAGPLAFVVPAVGQVAKKTADRLLTNKATLLKQITAAGKDARKIAEAYVRNTPAKDRNAAELSEIFERFEIDPKLLEKSKNLLFSDAAYMTGKGAVAYATDTEPTEVK